MGRIEVSWARLALLWGLTSSAGCSFALSYSDCTQDSECPRNETCNPRGHYCEVAAVERCNGVDDNHNGVSDDDEVFGVCEPAGTTAGMCRDGVLRCRNGARLECVRRTAPRTEVCSNGLDDDCDGTVDNSAACVQNYPASMNMPIGSDMPAVDGEGDDAPLHRVCLAGFTLDRYEVSLEAFTTFLSTLDRTKLRVGVPDAASRENPTVNYDPYLLYTDGGRTIPLVAMPTTPNDYTVDQTLTGFVAHNAASKRLPAVYVTWYGADRFCRWSGPGRHLPTEAEWWRAVRGAAFDHQFPWGNDPVTCSRANVAIDAAGMRCGGKLLAVDTLPLGRDGLGVHHLYGNANEWMWDFHNTDLNHTQNHYYMSLPVDGWCMAYPNGPLGPDAGAPIAQAADAGLYCTNCRMMHGRNFTTTDLRTGVRRWLDSDRGENIGGFRCSSGGADR